MVSGLTIGIAAQAAPSPLSDESFLLFLAESIDAEEGTLDPLNMVTDNPASQEQAEQEQNQEDENED